MWFEGAIVRVVGDGDGEGRWMAADVSDEARGG